jgi:hypothetical protein
MTHEAKEMQAAIGVLCVLKALKNGLVLVKLALSDALVDLDDVLPYDPTCTDVEMPASSVSHRLHPSRNIVSDPTSELPMRPSLRPTARPWAASLRYE